MVSMFVLSNYIAVNSRAAGEKGDPFSGMTGHYYVPQSSDCGVFRVWVVVHPGPFFSRTLAYQVGGEGHESNEHALKLKIEAECRRNGKGKKVREASGEIRTRDLHLTKVTLYRLSH